MRLSAPSPRRGKQGQRLADERYHPFTPIVNMGSEIRHMPPSLRDATDQQWRREDQRHPRLQTMRNKTGTPVKTRRAARNERQSHKSASSATKLVRCLQASSSNADGDPPKQTRAFMASRLGPT